jgi:predicted acetylornithine/succinylornithine family transaminase
MRRSRRPLWKESPVSDVVIAPAAPPVLAGGEAEVFAPTYALPRLELVSGRGARVTDAQGRTYLDFVSGIAVNALGHAAPAVARAVSKQMKSLVHVSNLFVTPPSLALAKALTEATGYDRVFFCNSGTEGIEAAVKFARAHAGARGREGRDLVAFRGGFHGRTGFAVSLTWTPSYRTPFEPLIPGVRFADYNDTAGLDAVLDERVAAVVIEPVQGEGGAVPAEKSFLKSLRARTSALGIPLIFDEIQIGMGRSGRLLAAEHYGVAPDMTVVSKALAGGLPLGAVLMRQEIAASLAPGMHGTTFGGGPVTTAAAAVVLDKVRRPAFLGKVRKRARELEAGLQALVTAHPSLSATRGLGLLRAVELAADAPFDVPALITAARAHDLLVVRGGARAVRLLPPLTVTPDEINEAMQRLDAALTSLEQERESR